MLRVPSKYKNMEVVDINADTEDKEQNFIHIELA